MLVIDQSGTKSIPFEKFPFEIVAFSDLEDVEPTIAEKFKRENLWYVIITMVGYDDVRIMAGYDTYRKAKDQLTALFSFYAKGIKIVKLNESNDLDDEEDKFNAEKALRRVLLF